MSNLIIRRSDDSTLLEQIKNRPLKQRTVSWFLIVDSKP